MSNTYPHAEHPPMPTQLETNYARAAEELAARQPDPGIYAMAYSQAAADEKVAAALYLKLRAERLTSEQFQKSVADNNLVGGSTRLGVFFVIFFAALIGFAAFSK